MTSDPASTQSALPTPEIGSSGLGSASALVVEVATLAMLSGVTPYASTEDLIPDAAWNSLFTRGLLAQQPFHPGGDPEPYLTKAGEERLRELLSSATTAEPSPRPEGLPPLDIAGVLWVAAIDLLPIQDHIEWVATLSKRITLINASRLASATKPEASPSPEKGLKLGDDRVVWVDEPRLAALFHIAHCALSGLEGSEATEQAVEQNLDTADALRADLIKWIATAQTPLASPYSTAVRKVAEMNIGRPVSTDEEEGQGLEDGGLQSRPCGGDS